jgi:hypothetical protein
VVQAREGRWGARPDAATEEVDVDPKLEPDTEALLERAAQEAEGIDLFEQPLAGMESARAREQAQGVEVFANPDAEVPVTTLVQGPPGEEILDGERVGLIRNGEDFDRGRDEGDEYQRTGY